MFVVLEHLSCFHFQLLLVWPSFLFLTNTLKVELKGEFGGQQEGCREGEKQQSSVNAGGMRGLP